MSSKENIIDTIPLVADLDGTIIKTDILYESLLMLLKKNPLYVFFIPFWLLKGKSFIKQMVVDRVDIRVENLPYNDDVIEFIKEEKHKGRKIYLATASHEIPAKKMADYLGIFDGVFATVKEHNLLSMNKTKRLITEFGEHGFDYIGDSGNDIHVWKSARHVYMVNPSNKTKNAVENSRIERIFSYPSSKIKLLIKQIRVYQWIKNILIFMPMLMAHKFLDLDSYLKAILAFFSFSLTASFVYVLNDLLDLESDRKHPRKKNRPIASGNMQVREGLMLLPFLLIAGVALAFFVNTNFVILLLSYLVLTSAYSFKLKKFYIIDIMVLSSLYTIRLIGGGLAVDVAISTWLLAFSLFIFLSLAVVKRYTEVRVMIQENKEKTAGRGYLITDESLLSSLGIGSGLISVLIFLLYADSPEVMHLYETPEFFYGVAPFLLYWLMRIWFKAHRGEMNDDPIVFTARDPVSYFIFAIVVVLIAGAML